MNLTIEDSSFSDRFELEEAMAKGTLFKSLYMPYKYEVKTPFTYETKEEKCLGIIQELLFAKTEITLFLDVHPNDLEAIEMLNLINKECSKMSEYYHKVYHALSNNCEFENEFTYATTHFPWEVK